MQDVMSLVEEAREWVDEHAIFVKRNEAVRKEDKWITRSAMQKAIRRGHTTTALRHAFDLMMIEPDYVWYSVQTCSTEDVGFGAPEAMLYGFCAQLKTFRQAVGQFQLLSALVTSLANSPKTRSACELSWVVDAEHKDVIREFSKMPANELLDIVAQPDVGSCYAALSVLRGITPKEVVQTVKNMAAIEQAKEIMGEQLPERMARVAQMAIDRPLDNMSVAVFPAMRLGNAEIDIEGQIFPPSVDINGFASEAYDMHEGSGRKAMGALWNQMKVKDPILSKVKTKSGSQLIGHAVFCVEGAMVDDLITSPDLNDLKGVQDHLSMTTCGVPADQVEYVLDAVREKIDRLNSIRKWAVGLKD